MKIYDKEQLGFDGASFQTYTLNLIDRVVRKIVPDWLLNLTEYGRKLVYTESAALTNGYITIDSQTNDQKKILLKMSLLQDVQLGPISRLSEEKRKEIQEIYRTQIHGSSNETAVLDDLVTMMKDPNKLYNRIYYHEQFPKMTMDKLENILEAQRMVRVDFAKIGLCLNDVLDNATDYDVNSLVRLLMALKFAGSRTKVVQATHPYTVLSRAMVSRFNNVLLIIPDDKLKVMHQLLSLFPGREDDVIALIDLDWNNIDADSIEKLPAIADMDKRFDKLLEMVIKHQNFTITNPNLDKMMVAIYLFGSIQNPQTTLEQVFFKMLWDDRDGENVTALIKAFPGQEEQVLELITVELNKISANKVWNDEFVLNEVQLRIIDPERRLSYLTYKIYEDKCQTQFFRKLGDEELYILLEAITVSRRVNGSLFEIDKVYPVVELLIKAGDVRTFAPQLTKVLKNVKNLDTYKYFLKNLPDIEKCFSLLNKLEEKNIDSALKVLNHIRLLDKDLFETVISELAKRKDINSALNNLNRYLSDEANLRTAVSAMHNWQ